jgi:ribosomal protein L7/L12
MTSWKPPAAIPYLVPSESPPASTAAPAPGRYPASSSALLEELRPLLQNGKIIEAIKRSRERLGVGLKEAKDAVDELRAQLALSPIPDFRPKDRVTDHELLEEVKRLVKRGQVLDAIKLYRQRNEVGLMEAKKAVLELAR